VEGVEGVVRWMGYFIMCSLVKDQSLGKGQATRDGAGDASASLRGQGKPLS